MRAFFAETLPGKTDEELTQISKDAAFYSEQERLLALKELEKRHDLPAELANEKKNLYDSVSPFPKLDSVPEYRIYKPNMMWVGSFFGGPLAAGYIIAENFRAFGQPKRARTTWIFTILATILVFGGIFLIPEEVLDKIPNILIPLVYTGIGALLMKHYQDFNIGVHFASGGRAFSWWRTVAVGLIGLVVTMGLIFVGVMVALYS